MDWGRAKSVLIFSFLVLNIILGYQLWFEVRDQLSTNIDVTDLPPETLQIMQEKNIRLLGKIPAGNPELQDLEYRFTTKPGNAVVQELEAPVESKIIFSSKKELADALGKAIPDIDHYGYDSEESTTDVFVMYRMSDGLPMFDVKLELYNSSQKIVAFKLNRVEQIEPGKAKAQSVLSASKALIKLIDNNYLQQDAVIKDIRLGYHGQNFGSEQQYSAPSWRVLLESGEVFYVHAISAEVFTETEPEAVTQEGQ
ncbi:two-component system regulatory protein YycI [Paenibacillus tarimensis]